MGHALIRQDPAWDTVRFSQSSLRSWLNAIDERTRQPVAGPFATDADDGITRLAAELLRLWDVRAAASVPTFENTAWQRSLANAHNWMSGLRWIQQDWDGAADHARNALEIAQRLAQKDSANSDLQGTLATAHSRHAQVWVSLGLLNQAQLAYEQAFTIYTTQLEKDPRNAGWRDILSDLHAELGWIQECRGHFAQALEHHRTNLEISQGLVAEGEKREGWQRDLALAHMDCGRVLLAQGSAGDAMPHLEEAVRTFGHLLDAERPGTLLDCAGAKALLARACKQQGDFEQAARLTAHLADLNWRPESVDTPSRARMLAELS